MEDHQMEMMLMQMEKLGPEFYSSYTTPDVGGIPTWEFANSHQNINQIAPNDNNFLENCYTNSNPSNISFSGGSVHPDPLFQWEPDEYPGGPDGSDPTQKRNSMAAMREMIFRIAAMQPIHIDPESVKPPKRRNVKISTDPQSVAARHRRERISERIRILQRLVPGGTKMDTASMLDEAIHYVKFLKNQVQSLERVAANRPATGTATGIGFPVPMASGNYFPVAAATKGFHQSSAHQHLSDA